MNQLNSYEYAGRTIKVWADSIGDLPVSMWSVEEDGDEVDGGFETTRFGALRQAVTSAAI